MVGLELYAIVSRESSASTRDISVKVMPANLAKDARIWNMPPTHDGVVKHLARFVESGQPVRVYLERDGWAGLGRYSQLGIWHHGANALVVFHAVGACVPGMRMKFHDFGSPEVYVNLPAPGQSRVVVVPKELRWRGVLASLSQLVGGPADVTVTPGSQGDGTLVGLQVGSVKLGKLVGDQIDRTTLSGVGYGTRT